MAAALDSPSAAYPESPIDQEDIVFPCKGCGEILEEGKAFELAGNRWHIDCFRCNTCGTLLDSDANLLLLGDGSLICNNCTYSCSACGNKIEDLAILTGDQAFCSGCFRCRNCKRKIENLRYARTSQGIFCMSCHESLMARRRKKARGTPKPSSSQRSDKALPSLPPGAAMPSAFTPDIETPDESYSESHTPPARSPKDRYLGTKNGTTTNNYKRDVSPLSEEIRRDGPTLPASTYYDGRSGNGSSDEDDGQERGFLHMAFDPTPISGPPPGAVPLRKQIPKAADLSPPAQKENQPPRDYFHGRERLSARPPPRDFLREEQRPGSSRSASGEREPERLPGQAKPSPHILFQEKGRARKTGASESSTPMAGSMSSSPVIATVQERTSSRPKPQTLNTGSYTLGPQEGFKLQEVPKSRRRGSKASGPPTPISPIGSGRRESARPISPVSVDSQHSGVNPFDDPKRKEAAPPGAAPVPPKHADRNLPLRGDSLGATVPKAKPAVQGSPTPAVAPSMATQTQTVTHSRHASGSSAPSSSAEVQSSNLRLDNRSQTTDPSTVRTSFDAIPPRSTSRPSAPSKSVANDDFIAPRAPPPPPSADRHKQHESISTMPSERSGQPSPALGSAGLPKYNSDGAFSMEDEMGRILRGDKREKTTDNSSSSVLRRVSNAVKHGRSISEHRSVKSPATGSMEFVSPPLGVASPSISSPTTSDSAEQVRVSLKRAQQRIAELEAEKRAMQDKIAGSSEIRAMNSELNKKRTTMSELDREREMVMRELMIMTEHLSKAKDSGQPLDLGSLKSNVVKDFGDSLEQLKTSLSSQIEELMRERSKLTEEIANLIQMKDKGFQEYESLSTKNTQLLQHNNELLRNIQGVYQDNRSAAQAVGGANGLGIYQQNTRVETPGAERNLGLVNTDSSMPNLLSETEAQPATILDGPQVVNIRKGMKPNKFNWRKGGEKVAKNVTKGLKGAFASDRSEKEPGPYSIGVPYHQTQQAVGGSDQGSLASRKDTDGKGFGFFGPKNGVARVGNGLGHMKNLSSNNLIATDGSTLFGSELVLRCEYEGRLIPSVVTRCVQEVEIRGMDVEGVYRKSGGAGQVKLVQQGFEKDGDFDISDEDLDVHAVTSALKQYFRKLPTPLITYDVYDGLLEAGQQQDKEKQVPAFRAALAELPDAHRDTLQYLIQHLARVMAHEPQNLMTPLNLAVVFAPTIMRPQSIEREMSDMQIQRTAVQALLEHHKTVFADD